MSSRRPTFAARRVPTSQSNRQLPTYNLPKVLVVDDQPNIRRLVEVALGSSFSIVQASNAQEAMAAIREHAPSLVVLDIMLPGGVDGLGILDAIRASPQTRAIKVMLMSAKGQASDVQEGIGRGADDYIVKPFLPSVLASRVKLLLDR